MISRFPAVMSVVLASCGFWAALTAEERDIITRKAGPPIAGYIQSEGFDSVTYLLSPGKEQPNNKIQTIRFSDIEAVTYAGMDDGLWQQGQSQRTAGNFIAAAETFQQLASTGSREWEKVRGALAAGDGFELAGKLQEALVAFTSVVDDYAGDATKKPPVAPHRLWLDAKYRQGMVQAALGLAEADKTAADLEAYGKKEALSAAEARANAIRAARAGKEKNATKFAEFSKKAVMRPQDGMDTWRHFLLLRAEVLRQLKQPKDALAVYRELASQPQTDVVAHARLLLGNGLALLDSGDKDAALLEFVRLDALPLGSPAQRAEARVNAAQLLWANAQTLKANATAMKDERRAAYQQDSERTARTLAQAAAAALGEDAAASVAAAKALLKTMDASAPTKK